jgi:hypothetical protein
MVTIALYVLQVQGPRVYHKERRNVKSATDMIQSFLQLFLFLKLHKPVLTHRIFLLVFNSYCY